MKNCKFLLTGGLLLSLAVFQGCQNCDEAVATAKKGFDTQLNSVTDSLNGAWKANIDSLTAAYEARVVMLDSLVAAKNTSASTTKKPGVKTEKDPKKAKMDGEKTNTAEDKKSKMEGEEQKKEESLDKKKKKISGN